MVVEINGVSFSMGLARVPVIAVVMLLVSYGVVSMKREIGSVLRRRGEEDKFVIGEDGDKSYIDRYIDGGRE